MNTLTTPTSTHWLNKAPEITLSFWIIKIMCTTVGETGADYLAVNAGLGQTVTRVGMTVLLVAALIVQLRKRCYTPWIYWLTVVLVSIVGTQITDLLTDGLRVSLYVSTSVFAVALAAIFAVWYAVERSLSIHEIFTRKGSCFTGRPFCALLRWVRQRAIWPPKRCTLASPGAWWGLAP